MYVFLINGHLFILILQDTLSYYFVLADSRKLIADKRRKILFWI